MVIQPLHNWLLSPPLMMWETWDFGGTLSYGFAEGMPAFRCYDGSGNVIRMPGNWYLHFFFIND